MNSKSSRINLLLDNKRISTGIGIVVAIVLISQLIIYALSQVSILDEGLYLVKGYLFAKGKYQPFQDYGPWTNHMPFSYLLPGYIQAWFGPGLRTGRYLSIGIGVLLFFGIWVVGNRLGGRWGGIFTLAAFAFNPAQIKIYSIVASQGLIACMLVWIIALTVGGDRPKWQIMLGSFLSGVIILTRMNMAPVFPILLVYIFWEYGSNTGKWSLIAGLIPFIGGHIYYWPGIMTLWAKWLPTFITPFLDPFRAQAIGGPVWQPQMSLYHRIISFIEGFRYHYIALLGFIIYGLTFTRDLLVNKSKTIKSEIFLTSLFIILFIGHLWASLGNNFCVFCFSAYLSYFSFIGLFLLIWSIGRLLSNLSRRRQNITTLVICVLSIFLAHGFSTFIINDSFVRSLMLKSVPRFAGMRILPGEIPLWGLLENIYGWNYLETHNNIQRILSLELALFSGIVFSLLVFLISHKLTPIVRGFMIKSTTVVATKPLALLLMVVIGLALSPTKILAGDRHQYDCGLGTLNAYEQAGAHLAEVIEPGSSVYWRGGLSSVPLLYLKDANIFPAQLNADYSFRDGGDLDELVKYGLWNQSLAEQWAQDADIILIAERYFDGWLAELIYSKSYSELVPTELVAPCQKDSSIHIFRRIP